MSNISSIGDSWYLLREEIFILPKLLIFIDTLYPLVLNIKSNLTKLIGALFNPTSIGINRFKTQSN